MLVYWILFLFIAGAGSLGIPASAGTGGVAYFAHIDGFAFGYVVTRLLVKPKPTTVRWIRQ